MPAYYAKRALEILREEGAVELFKSSRAFILNRLDPRRYYRCRLHTLKNHLRNHIKYDAPPSHPYQPIYINAKKVEYHLYNHKRGEHIHPQPGYGGLGQIKSNWDHKKHADPIKENPVVKGFEEKYKQGKDWEDTEYYTHQVKKRKGDKNHKKLGFDTIEDYLEKHFKQYSKLYDKINNEGYIPNHKGSRASLSRDYPTLRDTLEVLVAIDRKGQIHLIDGQHRLSIARLLDLKIPVHVLCRHKQWQELRDEIHNNGLPEDRRNLRDHPDLQDIIDG